MNNFNSPSSSNETSHTESEIVQETKDSLSSLNDAIQVYNQKKGFAGLIAAIKVFLGITEQTDDEDTLAEAQDMMRQSTSLEVIDGKVDPNQLNQYLTVKIANTRLNGYVPADGATYGIRTGAPTEWARFMTALADKESDFRVNCVGDVGVYEGNSNGLYQLSPNDATRSLYQIQSTPFTQAQLIDPVQNTNAAIIIMEKLILRDGVIAQHIEGTPGSDRENPGASAYWGPLRRGWTPTEEGW